MISGTSEESAHHLASLRERIRCNLDLLKRIVACLERSGKPFTSDTVVEEFGRLSTQYSLFTVLQSAIGRLLHNGKKRTAETYVATLCGWIYV